MDINELDKFFALTISDFKHIDTLEHMELWLLEDTYTGVYLFKDAEKIWFIFEKNKSVNIIGTVSYKINITFSSFRISDHDKRLIQELIRKRDFSRFSITTRKNISEDHDPTHLSYFR